MCDEAGERGPSEASAASAARRLRAAAPAMRRSASSTARGRRVWVVQCVRLEAAAEQLERPAERGDRAAGDDEVELAVAPAPPYPRARARTAHNTTRQKAAARETRTAGDGAASRPALALPLTREKPTPSRGERRRAIGTTPPADGRARRVASTRQRQPSRAHLFPSSHVAGVLFGLERGGGWI